VTHLLFQDWFQKIIVSSYLDVIMDQVLLKKFYFNGGFDILYNPTSIDK